MKNSVVGQWGLSRRAWLSRSIVACACVVAGPGTFARHADSVQSTPRVDVFYAPTPQDVVDAMLRAARVTRADVIYDLGSGDGRIPITAAKVYGARGVGVELDPRLIAQAQQNARAAGVADRVQFLSRDLFATDISPASVVTLYLTPHLNFRLLPKLNRELKPGSRVVSHQWEMMDPADKYEYRADQKLIVGNSVIYVWTVPILRTR